MRRDCSLCSYYDMTTGVCLNSKNMTKNHVIGRNVFYADELNPRGDCALYVPSPLKLSRRDTATGLKRFFRRK